MLKYLKQLIFRLSQIWIVFIFSSLSLTELYLSVPVFHKANGELICPLNSSKKKFQPSSAVFYSDVVTSKWQNNYNFKVAWCKSRNVIILFTLKKVIDQFVGCFFSPWKRLLTKSVFLRELNDHFLYVKLFIKYFYLSILYIHLLYRTLPVSNKWDYTM